MKLSTFLPMVMVLVASTATPSHSWAQLARTSRYDTRFMPITAEMLKQKLEKNRNDPVEMYALLFRADRQKLMGVAYRKMKVLYGRETQNAVVAASYALALDILRNNYGDTKREEPLPCPIQELEQRDQVVQRAFKLNPKLWLTYVVQGVELTLESNYPTVKPGEGRLLLQTAVKLAPNVSYTHLWLGFNYSAGADDRLLPKKEASYLKAAHLRPVTVKPLSYLLTIYAVQRPNRAKLKATAQAYVKALPPGIPVRATTRQQLANYGAPIPWPNPKTR